jgi:hypothetical protein
MVPNPAHSSCESWLQSVWAVGRHLRQSSSAVDAFAAPGTYKQLTPQITANLMVHGTNLDSSRRLVWHLQTAQRVKCN